MTKPLLDIKIESLITNPAYAKCQRCWKYTPECGYDKNKGCENLLCNRCELVLAEHFKNHKGYIEFKEERLRIFR